ncbi:hypothetical protein [Solitalea koreensis]|uniref:Phage major capsid protein, HK97 family n=1 Tax=Solitalea koreensis TaxID=543615 RepID=A0A521BLR7_9SPHI|nr:hypothetical protein [Solitalea koreensis]SMO48094.1 hypothetical protein SAMN06265350_102327 [Solitalea koreensis]
MKNHVRALIAFLVFTLIMSPVAMGLADATGLPLAVVGLAIIASTVVAIKYAPQNSRYAKCGVEVEIWANYIIERLWKDNAFLKTVYSDDDYVLAGKVVHIPQPGSAPAVVKNRTSFPATAVGRTDTDVNYSLDVYTTTPTHIQDAEKIELSYNKIDSVFGDHAGALAETIGDDIIVKWLTSIAADSKLLTTGGATAGTAPSATGNRKLFVHDDLRRAMTKLNVQGISKMDRNALLPSNMLDQLIQSLSNTQYRDFSQYMDAKNGIIGKLYGFNILERSAVAVSDAANVVKPLGAAAAATDNEVAVIYQKDTVTRALGQVKFFENPNDPQYYGDVYSALVRMGGRRRRSDDAGIIMINQDASA